MQITVIDIDMQKDYLRRMRKAAYMQMLIVICHSDPTSSNMARVRDTRAASGALHPDLPNILWHSWTHPFTN